MKAKKINLFKFVCQDKVEKAIHPSLCYVYHDPETLEAVATDAYICAISKTSFDENLAGKLVNRFGDIRENDTKYQYTGKADKLFTIGIRYPEWQRIRPIKKDYMPIKDFQGWNVIFDAVKAYKSLRKENRKKRYFIRFSGAYIRAEHADLICNYMPGADIYQRKGDQPYTYTLQFKAPGLEILTSPVFPGSMKQVSGALYAID